MRLVLQPLQAAVLRGQRTRSEGRSPLSHALIVAVARRNAMASGRNARNAKPEMVLSVTTT